MNEKPSIAFRVASTDDLEGLLALVDELDLLHRDALPDVFQPRETGSLRALIQSPTSDIIVAVKEGALIGFAAVIHKSLPRTAVRAARDLVEIDMLVVASSHRGRGFGKKLVALAEQWTRDRGVDECELGVWEFNDVAIEFYESVGFAAVSRRMSKSLNVEDEDPLAFGVAPRPKCR